MKRFFCAAVLLAILSVPVFAQAQVRVRAYGQGAFLPLMIEKFDGKDAIYSAGTSSGLSERPTRIRFEVMGTAGSSGIQIRLNMLDNTNQFNSSSTDNVGAFTDKKFVPYIGDYARIWTQPFDWLRFDLGKFKQDDLRGRVGKSLFHNWVLDTAPNQDFSFQRFETNNGAMVTLTPIQNLFIGFMWGSSAAYGPDPDMDRGPGLGTTAWDENNLGFPSLQDFTRVWKNIHVGIGYKFGKMGNIRAQFIGEADPSFRVNSPAAPKSMNSTESGGRIIERVMSNRFELAGAWSPGANLTVDLGVKIPLPTGNIVTRDTFYPPETPPPATQPVGKGQEAYQVALTGEYSWEYFEISGRLDGIFGGWYEYIIPSTNNARHAKLEQGMDIFGRVMASYDFGIWLLGGELGLQYTGKSKHYLIDDSQIATPAPALETAGGTKFGMGLWARLKLTSSFIQTGVTFQPPVSYDGEKVPLKFFVPVLMRVSL